jgi:hypothetical protein
MKGGKHGGWKQAFTSEGEQSRVGAEAKSKVHDWGG